MVKVSGSFDLGIHAGRWFSWSEVEECFWPGKGVSPQQKNPELGPVASLSGIYLLAWSEEGAPSATRPLEKTVKYIGQTKLFRRRIEQFGWSAGFWDGQRFNGHSAGWRWPFRKWEHLWVGFFPLKSRPLAHLHSGLLHWYEALALDEHYQAHGVLPQINAVKQEVEFK